MANGFVQRFKGKISAKVAYFLTGGLYQDANPATLVFQNAGAPTNGTNGTLAGIAQPGSLLIDTTNKTFYQNTNTKASPTWTALTTATGAGTYTGTFDGVIGGNTPAAATVTTLSASGLATVASAKIDTGTKTATATAGAATLNKMSGVITSESLTTAKGSTYTLTITNSTIAASDIVFASAQLGSATTGSPEVLSVTPAAGSVVVVVQNEDSTNAFNGTIKVSFVAFKA